MVVEVINDSDIQADLIVRETQVVTRLELSQDFLHPENVRLQLEKETRVHPLDIGALAYTIRQPQKNHHLANLPWLVDESSIMPSRRKLLVKLHDYVVTTGHNDKTIDFHLKNFIMIVTWLDEHGYTQTFETEVKARGAYKAYVDKLNHQLKSVALDKISPTYANALQLSLMKLLELYWGEDVSNEIIREIPVIKFKRGEGEAPEERKVRFATRTFLCLARGFKEFVVDNKPFPYLLTMPDYECYIFPSNANACVTPYTTSEHAIYNYQEGRISTPEEYIAKSNRKVTIKEAKRETEKSTANLTSISETPHDFNRLNYAVLALNSYMQLFILMTGIHRSELIQLEYEDNFAKEKDLLKNDFRAIKFRAAGREVAYHLGNRKGLEIFKEYIQLRNWVLNGVKCRYLFFTMQRDGIYTGKFLKVVSGSVYRVYNGLKGKYIPSSFKAMTASRVRKYKTVVWNELDVEQQVIADSLNHTLKTNHNSYAVSSPDRQQAEFALYWESAKAASKRIPIKIVSDNDTSIASGHCDDINHPDAMESNPPIEPDCKTQFGCLYCEHYLCHADEEDIKKLYSLLYVINAVRDMAADFNHSDKLLLELSLRVQELLKQISEKSDEIKSLVEATKEEVMEHGLLTPFWEFKLQRYEAMGVVING